MIFQGWVYPSQLHVPIQDPIYAYLDCLATQGELPAYMNTTFQLTRDYIAGMLIHLEEERNKLCTMDIKILDEYISDYRHQIKNKPYFQLIEQETTCHPLQL